MIHRCITVPAPGGLAHLARAFEWHSKGDEFDPRILHCLLALVNIFGSVENLPYICINKL